MPAAPPPAGGGPPARPRPLPRGSDLSQPVSLGPEAPREGTPPLFVGDLRPTQQAVLHRMLEMERTKKLACLMPAGAAGAPVEDEGAPEVPTVLRYNAGTLAAPFAFGKTVVVTALVALDRPPLEAPAYLNLPVSPRKVPVPLADVEMAGGERLAHRRKTATHRDHFGTPGTPGVLLEGSCRRVASTLVIASTSVISHWEDTFQEFAPHLSCYTIDGVASARKYVELVTRGFGNDYHVVMLKLGTMTLQRTARAKRALGFAPEEDSRESVPSPAALVRLLPGVRWDRVVVDDFDTIALDGGTPLPAGSFVWYVSATRKQTLRDWYDRDVYERRLGTALEDVVPGGWSILGALRNTLLFGHLRVTCTDRFLADELVLPRPAALRYRVAQPAALALLRDANLPAEVQEAINSGAVRAAARLLGCDCESPYDLAAWLFSKNKQALADAVEELDAWRAAAAALEARPAGLKPAPQSVVQAVLSAIRQGWEPAGAGDLPACVPDDVRGGPNLAKVSADFVAKRTAVLEKSSSSLERLRRNAAEEECQVCLDPWEDGKGTYYVTGCCQTVLCPTCLLDARGGGRADFRPNCPQCSEPLLRKGVPQLRAVNREIELEKLTASSFARDLAAGGPASAAPAAAPAVTPEERINARYLAEGKDGKVRALLELVLGLSVTAEAQETAPFPDKLLGLGGPYVPPPPPGEDGLEPRRRFLLYSQHPETTRRLKAIFEAFGVDALHLSGSRKNKDHLIRRFRTSDAPLEVMIIASGKDCAGIHLPECTDLIFFYRMASAAVEAQFLGRAQRPGRRASLRVHHLCYADE